MIEPSPHPPNDKDDEGELPSKPLEPGGSRSELSPPTNDDDIPFDDASASEEWANRWDKDDPARQNDQMAPPTEPCECYCLHCGRTFMSDKIWFQKVVGSKDGFDGFWMCPTPNCGGAGFTFDIHPTDPNHPANADWHYDDENDEEIPWDDDPEDFLPLSEGDEPDSEYDPDESKYKHLDELYGDAEDDDLEGEEWKYGLQPGERPQPHLSDEMRRERDEEEKKYDMPDERPRELDWTNREEDEGRKKWGPDDDIPF